MMGRRLVEAVADLERNGGERGYGEVVNDGGLDPDTGQGIASTHWHQGAAAATCWWTRRPARSRWSGCTRPSTPVVVVDREGAELQNEGSMIMGLGTALFEQVDQADGQLTGTNLRLQRARHPATCRDATHQLIESEAPRPTVWARPPCRRCPPRSATRSARWASSSPSCP